MTMPRQNKPIIKPTRLAAFLLLALVLILGWGWASLCGAQTIVDNRGRNIDVSVPFSRIISLYGAHTENLFYLGADSQVVGVSVNDEYPDQVRGKQRFSYHDDPEKILSIRPDLVLIRPMIDNGYPQFVRQLEAYGITVVSLQPSSVEEMYEYWKVLGKLTGNVRSAENLVNEFKGKIQNVQALTGKIPLKKRVYFQAIHSRMKTFTPGAMPIFALETAGGINVAADAIASRNTNVAIYGKEQILVKAGEIDVLLAQQGVMNPIEKEQILSEPGFQIIKAVKEGQVYMIDENIVSRPVPRLFQGVLAIGKVLYPEIFTSKYIEKEAL